MQAWLVASRSTTHLGLFDYARHDEYMSASDVPLNAKKLPDVLRNQVQTALSAISPYVVSLCYVQYVSFSYVRLCRERDLQIILQPAYWQTQEDPSLNEDIPTRLLPTKPRESEPRVSLRVCFCWFCCVSDSESISVLFAVVQLTQLTNNDCVL